MKSKLSKVIIGTLSGTLFIESCTNGYYLNYSIDEINETLSKHSTPIENTALPIDVHLNDKQREYLLFLQTLAKEIITDSSIARKFIGNPSEYIKSKGFNSENISIDSKLTKIILALADDEICNAIENGNVEKYLKLLDNKGLIDKVSIRELNQIKKHSYSIKATMEENNIDTEIISVSAFAFAVAVLVGAVAVVWAVVVEHFLAANAIAATTAIAWKVGAVTNGSETNKRVDLLVPKALQIWDLKSQDPTLNHLVADKFTSFTVDSLIEYFRTNIPEFDNQTDLPILRNAIIANLQNMPYDE